MPSEQSDSTNRSSPVPEGPLQVASDCWMVGYRNPQALLQCNTYLRKFPANGRAVNVCIDPGSPYDFPVVKDNICQLVDDLSQVDAMTVNHQDPDVAGNTPQFCEANPRGELIVGEEVWRLLQHLMLKPGKVRLANPARTAQAAFTPQHQFQILPTPFCHFRGAMAFYDPELRTLFSGDLFGGLNRVGAVYLLATEEDWDGIAQFHQIYMPSREVLRHSVRQILNLKPRVEVIAPQHGYVITGDLVSLFLERMHELLVGSDLMAADWDLDNLGAYREVISRMIEHATREFGGVEVACRINDTKMGDGLEKHLHFHDGKPKLEREGYAAVAKAFARLTGGEDQPFVTSLRQVILNACTELGVPIPPIGVGIQEQAESRPEGAA